MKWSLALFLMTSGCLLIVARAWAADFTSILHSGTSQITEHGECRNVTNSHASSRQLFVPTRTPAEWTSFRNNPPPGVTVNPCCPTNYVLVPALAPYTTNSFCVAKYHMKNVGGVATSQAAQKPWSNINKATALAACQALGTGYDMINNAQWQTIARNIENTGWNWQGGSVGSGRINNGSGNSQPYDTAAASTDDNQACYLKTDHTCSSTVWAFERRTFRLASGLTIWDFGGNIWTWVKDTYASLGVSPAIGTSWQEQSAMSANNNVLFGPAVATRDNTHGIGRIQGGTVSLVRGGAWYDHENIGIYSTRMNLPTSDQSDFVGFRCVYAP